MAKKTTQKKETESELRQDIVTGDWVVIATGRAKRPDEFKKHETTEENSIASCPFEDPEESGQEKDELIYRTPDGEWTLRVFPNLYPAVSRGRIPKSLEEGPYFGMTGTGYHELVVPRDHYNHFALMDTLSVAEMFDAYQDRYLSLMNKKNIRYISIIHNHGRSAGASLTHPHSQLFAIPVTSPYIRQELKGSEEYERHSSACVYCTMVEYEAEKKTRVIAENDEFVSFTPYASRAAFEMWVMPKFHQPYFERTTNERKLKLAEVFQKTMKALYTGLDNPDYNFYLHTAPCDGKDYPHFHWHIEIIPRTAIWAGFELSTGIEISTIQPEKAAQYLRENLDSSN